MKILKVDIHKPDPKIVRSAVNTLSKGGLVVYPTDTAYGLGVNAFIEKYYRLFLNVKERSIRKPTHIIVKDWEMIKNVSYVNKLARKIYDKYLPGPITIVLKKKDIVPDLLTGGLPTIGVRVPNCKLTQEISKNINYPYTTSSANREGDPTPYCLNDLKKVLDLEKVDLVLYSGKLPHTPPSTMVDLSTDIVKVLREGPVKKEQIFETLQ